VYKEFRKKKNPKIRKRIYNEHRRSEITLNLEINFRSAKQNIGFMDIFVCS
jgi:hypothetical protein